METMVIPVTVSLATKVKTAENKKIAEEKEEEKEDDRSESPGNLQG